MSGNFGAYTLILTRAENSDIEYHSTVNSEELESKPNKSETFTLHQDLL